MKKLHFGIIPGTTTNQVGFYEQDTGQLVGPPVTNPVSASYVLYDLVTNGVMAPEEAERLIRDEVTPTYKDSGQLPSLSFVRSKSGRRGVFVLSDAHIKISPAMRNSVAARAAAEMLRQSGQIDPDCLQTLHAEITAVFDEILADPGASVPQHRFVRTYAGHRGVFISAIDDTPTSGPFRTPELAAKALEYSITTNAIAEGDITRLQTQVEAVFRAINAERQVNFVLCESGECGVFLHIQTRQPYPGLPNNGRYTDKEAAFQAGESLYASQGISQRELRWLTDEIEGVFAQIERRKMPRRTAIIYFLIPTR